MEACINLRFMDAVDHLELILIIKSVVNKAKFMRAEVYRISIGVDLAIPCLNRQALRLHNAFRTTQSLCLMHEHIGNTRQE